MRARYLTNACILIETPDVRILVDPWFTEGVYEGSWFHAQPVEPFGERADAIFVSHLHPDHYDPQWIRGYLQRFPETALLVAVHDPPYLPALMRRHGFCPTPFKDMTVGGTTLTARRARLGEFDNIDSVLRVESDGKSLLAWSDAPNDQDTIAEMRSLGPPDIAFLPFSGAGPFPQCYELPTAVKLKAAASKAQVYEDLWAESLEALSPRFAVPYAGDYLLGGRLGALNHLRGALEPEELPDATVLEAGQWIGVDGPEEHPGVKPLDVNARIASLADRKMVYDNDPEPDGLREGLLAAVAKNPARSEQDYWLGFHWGDSLSVNIRDRTESRGTPRTDIFVDPKHLAGLLERRFHWNNAEVGSHLRFSQEPANQGVNPGTSIYLAHLHG